jgi:purine-cytosine permease-like protein
MGSGTFIETRSIDYVPARRAARQGLASVAGLVLGRCAPGDPRGGHHSALPLGGNVLWSAIAVLGCLLGTFFMAFHSTQGPQLGLPQMIQSRPQFGYTGALLVWGVAMVTYVGYNAFNHGAGRAGACTSSPRTYRRPPRWRWWHSRCCPVAWPLAMTASTRRSAALPT